MTAPPTWAYVTGPFEVWNHRFAIGADTEELGAYLGELWAACGADVEPETTYGLDREHRLYVDDEVAGQPGKPSIALRDLVRRVNADVIAAAGNLVVVHAAGAARDGKGVLFPGAQGSGKTTLVAGLVRDGWDYLSDEAVAIDPETLALLPYPKPLSVDPGSWEVLADLRPELPDPLQPYLAEQWQVPPARIRKDSVSSKEAVAVAIVGPVYSAGAATGLQRLSKAQGLMLLADGCFTIHSNTGHLEVLARVAAGTPAHRLVVANLEDACAATASVLRRATGE